ncbi:MAG: DUF368 domain-containing protein [Thermonemataceae bacterium]
MRNIRENIWLFLKGVAMGSADVVPGVSGGTIAFITGIYAELLRSIKAVDARAVQLLFQWRWPTLWRKVNGSFLVVLIAGIVTAVASLARLVLYLLTHHPILLWSFFFGLILASSWVVGKRINRWNYLTVLMGLLGVGIAYFVTIATPAATPNALWFIFLSGALAICAMILPGISGSFILVLLSKYEYILQAVKSFRIEVVFTFIVGCLVGIIAFSRVLSYLLQHYFNLTIALLAGFMLGSLNKVYPWKRVLEVDKKGKPLFTENVLPQTYTASTGEEAYVVWAILLAILGFVIVYVMERASQQPSKKETV